MTGTNHIAAIHTLKSKLALSEDDYRALLPLTGKRSSRDMNQAERRAVRGTWRAWPRRWACSSPRAAAP